MGNKIINKALIIDDEPDICHLAEITLNRMGLETKSANDIATGLDIKGVSAYVRVSELKKQAVNKLIDNVDHSQVIDYL